MKKNKARQQKQQKEIELDYQWGQDTLRFYLSFQKNTEEWVYPGVGRSLSVEMFCQIENKDQYAELHDAWFGLNFIKEYFLVNSEQPLKQKDRITLEQLFKWFNLSRLMFDFMIIKCTVAYEDEDQLSSFTRFHGIGLTINGRKHIGESVSDEENSSTPTLNKTTN